MSVSKSERRSSMKSMLRRKLSSSSAAPLPFRFLNQTANSLAEHLAMLQQQRRSTLTRGEFRKQAWSKHPERAPTVTADAIAFDAMARLVAWTVLEKTELSERAQVYAFWVETTAASLQLHDFSSACAVLAGLEVTSVYRLRETKGRLTRAQSESLEAVRAIASSEHNYSGYRAALAEAAKQPRVPHLMIHLHGAPRRRAHERACTAHLPSRSRRCRQEKMSPSFDFVG
mmetsp:Transcript_9259/g.24659  ORF Transcript_9259/g.24659 Transcript_9259/m.24659 type:complete len:229 (-) Transcript_9259:143-829(-)